MSAVVLAGLSVGVAEAAGGGPKATGGAHAVGMDGDRSDLSFNAQGTPADAKGRVNYRAVDAMGEATSFKGEVTCYTQEGNRATFSGVVRKSENVEETTFLVEVVDNGEGAALTPPGDTFRVETPAPASSDDSPCGEPTGMDQNVVTNGNIQVHESE